MAKLTIELSRCAGEAAARTAEILKAGGVAVFPTETVYGIGVAAGNAGALAKLRRLKQRGGEKPFQFLVESMETAERVLGAVFSSRAKKLAAGRWPGPLTIVVPAAGGDSTLGVRVPDSAFVLELCALLGGPVVSSSANPAGAAPPLDGRAADVFGDEVDVLVDGGPVPGGIPSTVVRCVGNEYEILRHGGVDAAEIESAWNGWAE